MGLLDSVLGSVINAQGQGGRNEGGLGALGGLVAMAAQNPQLVQAVMGMLANDGPHGGLGGLIAKFQQAGLGEVMASWLGNGANQSVTGDQLTRALGPDLFSQLGARMGVGSGEAASQLSQVLPGLIDQLTPHGQAPAGGLGNAADLMGVLGADGIFESFNPAWHALLGWTEDERKALVRFLEAL